VGSLYREVPDLVSRVKDKDFAFVFEIVTTGPSVLTMFSPLFILWHFWPS
jgi:hypothetical protein